MRHRGTNICTFWRRSCIVRSPVEGFTMFVLRLVLLTFGLAVLGAGAVEAQDSKMKFELYKDKAGEFRWRLKAGNGAVLATGGQGYKAVADAKNGIELVKKS